MRLETLFYVWLVATLLCSVFLFHQCRKGSPLFIYFTKKCNLMLNNVVPTKIQVWQHYTQHLRNIPSSLQIVHDKAGIAIIMERNPYFIKFNTCFYVPSFILTLVCVGITSEPQVFPFCKYNYHHLCPFLSQLSFLSFTLLAVQMCCCDTLTNCWAVFHKLKHTKTLESDNDRHTLITPASSLSGVSVWSHQKVSPCSLISPIRCYYDPLISVSVQYVITVRQAHQLRMRSSLFDREEVCVSAIRLCLIRPATSCSLIAHQRHWYFLLWGCLSLKKWLISHCCLRGFSFSIFLFSCFFLFFICFLFFFAFWFCHCLLHSLILWNLILFVQSWNCKLGIGAISCRSQQKCRKQPSKFKETKWTMNVCTFYLLIH